MRYTARVCYLFRSFFAFLAFLGVGFFLLTVFASSAQAQTPAIPPYQQQHVANNDDFMPSVDPSVPKDTHAYAQIVIVDVLSAVTCALSGVDPVRPNHPCLGVNPSTGVYGYATDHPNGMAGGALGAMAGYIGMVYTPTVSTTQYFDYVANNFGIVKPAYAQAQLTNCNTTANSSFGYGYCGLSPIFNTWRFVRDLAYALLVIAFVVLALGIMTRFQAEPRVIMTLQNQIPRVVIAIILITFSYAIAGFMIDLMWTVTYMGVNAISAGSKAEACGEDGAKKPIDQIANLYLLETPMNYTETIFDNNCEWYTMTSGLGSLSSQVSASIAKALGDLISSMLGLSPLNEAGDNCGLFDPLECIGYLIGFIIQMIIKLIVLITLLIALIRIWFELIKTAVLFLIYTIGGPIWIVFGLVPGRPLGFEKWLRLLFAHLAAFPLVAFCLVFAAVITKAFPEKLEPNSIFTPPLIGNPSMPGFGAILAFGMILITPGIPGLLREKLKVPPGKLGAQVKGSIGAGGAVAAAAYGYPIKRLTRKYNHQTGAPAGVLRDWISGRNTANDRNNAGQKTSWWFRKVGRHIEGHTPLDKPGGH